MVGLLLQDNDFSDSIPLPHVPDTAKSFRSLRACVLLIIVTVLERCAFYSLTLNLAFTLSTWYQSTESIDKAFKLLKCKSERDKKVHQSYNHLDTMEVAVIMIFFYLLCSFCSIIGGWLGDGKLGRYRTIKISLFLYLFGTVFYTVWLYVCMCNHWGSAQNGPDFCFHRYLGQTIQHVVQAILLTLSFAFMALGYGFFKPNIAPFGADQMRGYGAETLETFYLWFYLFTNIGSLLANCVSFMQTPYNSQLVYLFSYILTVVFIVTCIAVFHLGSNYYVKKEPSADAFETFFSILRAYVSHWNVNKVILQQHGGSRLELIKSYNGGPFDPVDVEAFKDMWRIIPVVFTLLVYWIIYSQFNSFYYFQGFYLSRPDWMPLSVVQLMNPLLITIFVPLLKNVVYPYLTKRGLHMSAFTRIMIGFTLITISLLAAVVVAVVSRQAIDPTHIPPPKPIHYFPNISRNHNYTTYIARDLSIFITAPQIIFVSLSEVFVIIAGMEFVYLEAPRALKSFAMGVFFAVITLGDLIAIILVVVVKLATSNSTKPWICNNLNKGYLDNFYIMLQGLMLLNMLLLWKLCKNFKSK